MQTEEAEIDQGQFDGSADPNPGGHLGWGWHLQMDGVELSAQGGNAPPSPDNTNNRGEYRGLIALLEDYIARGGCGPLKVRGDSQLVIKQVREEYACRTPHLIPLLKRVWSLVEQIPGGVDFEWVRREQNARADAAASGGKPQEGKFRDT